MVDNVRLALELGYLKVPEGVLLQPRQLQGAPRARTVIMTTGAQGEPTSALVRMANGDHPQVQIEPGDTVIISSNPIPGNEAVVGRTIDKLFRQGADVHYSRIEQVHVRGHASEEELKLMIRLTKPRFFVPVHGDYRHLVHHARLARSLDVPEENVFILTDGDVLELTPESGQVVDNIGIQNSYVDGLRIGDVDNVVLRDRTHLSKDGVVVVIVPVDRETGEDRSTLETRPLGCVPHRKYGLGRGNVSTPGPSGPVARLLIRSLSVPSRSTITLIVPSFRETLPYASRNVSLILMRCCS
jgi:ribonuclease J